MRVGRVVLAAAVLSLAVLGPACNRPRNQKPPADGGAGRLDISGLIAEQLDAELQFSPTLATWLGDHTSDDRLDDVRMESVIRELVRLEGLEDRLRRLPDGDAYLSPEQRIDLQLLRARVEAKRIELAEFRPHERNPIFYANLIAYGLDSLLGPNLVSLQGMRALRGRLAGIASICKEAQRNLKNPPEIWTRRAIDTTNESRDFVALVLPRLLSNITLPDTKLLDEVGHAREDAQRALDEFGNWLLRDLLPRSKGDWSLGRDKLQARLRAGELLDVPLELVQARAEFEHRETKRHFDELAKRIAGQTGAARNAAEALRLIEEDHPRPEELLRSTEAALDRAYELAQSHKLLSVLPVRPQVVEMPAYRFGFVQVSLPSPLEPERSAQVQIDPVDPTWKDKRRISDHLRFLNRSQLLLTAVHEVVPGHASQQAALRKRAAELSPIRQRSMSPAFLEGWSSYAEQLTAVELAPTGSAATPASDRLQLLALRHQLMRLGRLVTVLQLHGQTTPGPGNAAARLEEATQFLSDECYLDEYAARREAERATYDPLIGIGSLGRLQILKLRADFLAQRAELAARDGGSDDLGAGGEAKADTDLASFHDRLLSFGALPIPILRLLVLKQKDAGPSLTTPPEPPPAGAEE